MSHSKWEDKRNKERVTLSLSQEATKFVRVLRAESNAPSMSALFEEIIHDLQRRAELEQLNARTVAYYNSLSRSQASEEAAWGELGEEGLASAMDHEELAEPVREVIAVSR